MQGTFLLVFSLILKSTQQEKLKKKDYDQHEEDKQPHHIRRQSLNMDQHTKQKIHQQLQRNIKEIHPPSRRYYKHPIVDLIYLRSPLLTCTFII